MIRSQINTIYKEIRKVDALIPSAINEFSTGVNEAETVFNAEQFKRRALRIANIHKFLKLDPETDRQQAETDYKVKEFDSPGMVATRFGRDLDQILNDNNKLSGEISAGDNISIQADDTGSLYSDVPTFISIRGREILGHDLPVQLVESPSGDLHVLLPEETLTQGLTNRIRTRKGGYPLIDDFGLEEIAGQDYPEELSRNILLIQIAEQARLDKRISEVISVGLENEAGNPGTITINMKVKSINGDKMDTQIKI